MKIQGRCVEAGRALTHSVVFTATVTSTVHRASTPARLAGVHTCASAPHVPDTRVHASSSGVRRSWASWTMSIWASSDSTSAPEPEASGRWRTRSSPCLVRWRTDGSCLGLSTPQPHLTPTLITCAPEKLTFVQPWCGPEMMASTPWVPVLFEPWIEWTAGVVLSGCASAGLHDSGPQPSVHWSGAPLRSQVPV